MNDSEPPHPHGPELGRRNRRIVAGRLGWPDGAVEACEAAAAMAGYPTPQW